MAEPKKKSSSTRSGNRRTNKKVKAKGLSICLHCKQKKRFHFVCKNCGWINNKIVI